MLNHTKKIKEIYENIQRKIYYMIPEKWDKLYLYSSVLDEKDKEGRTGELFFYYIPKGILKKRPVNVYEIPSKFNLEESEYLKLVEALYKKIKELRNEFKKSETREIWTNLTMSIHNLKFKVDYDYTDLVNSEFSSYERHIIWRVEYLGINENQLSKNEKEIIYRYKNGAKTLLRQEHYDSGIYIQNIENMVTYTTKNDEEDSGYVEEISYNKKHRNQILFSKEELKDEKEVKEKTDT